MESGTFSEGVEPGGLRSKQDIKVLICYILSNIGEMLKSDIISVFQEEGLANYFEIGEAFLELTSSENIKVKNEKYGVYEVSRSGRIISDQLYLSLPFSVRDRAIKSAIATIKRRKNEEENKVKIEKNEFGYNITCSISGGNFDLLKLTIYAPNIDQAEKLRSNFRSDPEGLYRSVLSILTRNREMSLELKNMISSLMN